MEASKKLQDHGPCKSEEHNTQNKFKKKKNIQQPVFAGRHRPNY